MRWLKPPARLALLVLCTSALIIIPRGNAAEKAPLSVYFLDVEQGDATLIVAPSGKTMLIDGGKGGSGYKKKDKAKTVIIPFLKRKGISKIDCVIMTHADFDHIGGLVYLINETKKGSEYPLEIGEFLDPGQQHTTFLYQDLLEAVKNRPEMKYRQVKKGEKIDLGKGVTAEIVSPEQIFPKDPNNSSLVVRLACGKVSMILTGDAEEEAEEAMIKNYGAALKSTVLKAGHHGSANSSNTEFLNAVKPEVVVISVGERNTFKLPFKEAMDRLKATKAKIYRTDYQGTITITTDGDSYQVTTEREAPPPDKRWDAVKVFSEAEKININTATEEQLMMLPRIGKVKVHDIIRKRPFKSVDDLRNVSGIGEKILERIKPMITVGDAGKAKGAVAPAATAEPAKEPPRGHKDAPAEKPQSRRGCIDLSGGLAA